VTDPAFRIAPKFLDYGTIARGGVTIAVSTSGSAPALAGLLREAIDGLLPAEVGTWLEHAHELSRRQREAAVPMELRRPQLLETLNQLYESRARTPISPGPAR